MRDFQNPSELHPYIYIFFNNKKYNKIKRDTYGVPQPKYKKHATQYTYSNLFLKKKSPAAGSTP